MNSPFRAVLCLFAFSLYGCLPIGDCWPTVNAHITLDPKINVPQGTQVILVHVVKIYDKDVTGTDSHGIPITSAIHSGIGKPLGRIATGQPRAFDTKFYGFPYPSWYYAVVDLNNNRKLDPGEPYGIDIKNPIDTDCDPHETLITIDRNYE